MKNFYIKLFDEETAYYSFNNADNRRASLTKDSALNAFTTFESKTRD